MELAHTIYENQDCQVQWHFMKKLEIFWHRKTLSHLYNSLYILI